MCLSNPTGLPLVWPRQYVAGCPWIRKTRTMFTVGMLCVVSGKVEKTKEIHKSFMLIMFVMYHCYLYPSSYIRHPISYTTP